MNQELGGDADRDANQQIRRQHRDNGHHEDHQLLAADLVDAHELLGRCETKAGVNQHRRQGRARNLVDHEGDQ